MGTLLEKVSIRKYRGASVPAISGDIVLLDETDAEVLHAIVKLQNVAESVSANDCFHVCTFAFLQENLFKNGRILGVFVDTELIAFRVTHFPHQSRESLGLDLSFPRDMLEYIAHLSGIVVHPDYWGNGLAYRMTSRTLALLKDFGYTHICSTVFPQNFHSLANLFRFGFHVEKLAMKYGNKLRYILYKNLDEQTMIEPAPYVSVLSTDMDKAAQVLQNGFVGYAAEGNMLEFAVLFGSQARHFRGDAQADCFERSARSGFAGGRTP